MHRHEAKAKEDAERSRRSDLDPLETRGLGYVPVPEDLRR